MKVVALLCGVLASALAWGAPYLFSDLSPAFLALWPDAAGQQFVGTLVWHGLIATGLLGGLLAVLAPATGLLVLSVGAAGWVALCTLLPAGPTVELVLPAGMSALGAVFALLAAIQLRLRRRAERQLHDEDELEREDALLLEPDMEPRRASRLRGSQALRADVSDEPVDEPTEQVFYEPADAHADAWPDEPLAVYEPAPMRDYMPAPATRIIERRANPILVGLNFIVLLLLCAAVGLLLYSEYRSGALEAALGLAPAPPAGVALLGNSALERAAVAPRPDPPAEAAPALEPVAPEVRIATTPLDLAEISTTTWSDPFDYCAAVGTIDRPDRRFIGPADVPTLVAALPTAPSIAPGWRCVGGQVHACTAPLAAACEKAPSVADMVAYCAANPNAQNIAAPAGIWSCRGTRPEIPLGQAWPVDARGFLPAAWIRVDPPAASSG